MAVFAACLLVGVFDGMASWMFGFVAFVVDVLTSTRGVPLSDGPACTQLRIMIPLCNFIQSIKNDRTKNNFGPSHRTSCDMSNENFPHLKPACSTE